MAKMTSETPKPNARHGSLREAAASFSTTPLADTAADHDYLESDGHLGQVALQVLKTQAVDRSSGDGAGSVDEQDLARDVCARGRSKQDCGAHDFLGLGDPTCRSSGHSHFLPLRIAPKILGEGGPNH